MVARISLGVFEAGFGPGIPLYFSRHYLIITTSQHLLISLTPVITALFYTKHELGLRLAYWFGFAAVAGAFGGLIAFGIQHVHASIENWRLLFIIEVCSPCDYFCLLVSSMPTRAFLRFSSVSSP
jgi:MFS family permease